MFGKRGREESKTQAPKEQRCSFCKKSEHEVWKLIAGPTVCICDECVAVCVDILADDRHMSQVKSRYVIVPPPTVVKEPWPTPDAGCTFCGRVAELDMALVIENRALLCESCVSYIALAANEARKGEPNQQE